MSIAISNTTCIERFDHECGDVPVHVQIARFRGASGVEEIQLIARPTQPAPFDAQLDWLHRAGRETLQALGANARDAVLRRFFCSDVANQTAVLNVSPFANPDNAGDLCAVSWVGQPPSAPAHVAVWAYHIHDPRAPLDKRHESNTLTVNRGALCHCWTTQVTSPGGDSAFEQTHAILTRYEAALHVHNLSLADNAIRTWLYLRNIDVDYQEFAEARREYFARHGLTPKTHYIASTGIEGTPATPAARVALDAYAVAGVLPTQLGYIKALDHLSPTDAYGVTFERATTVTYRDRKHVLVSGTASIDRHGNVLHPGDVARQLDRTLDNVEALLHEAGARRQDMSMILAYVRNPDDATRVQHGIRERLGSVPLNVLVGAICRAEWLVEIEAQAILPDTNPELPPF